MVVSAEDIRLIADGSYEIAKKRTEIQLKTEPKRKTSLIVLYSRIHIIYVSNK